MSLPDPIALQRRARDLAHRHPAEVRTALAVDPISVVRDEFGITIVERPRGGRGCDLDASYDEETNTITHWTDFDTGGHFAAMEVPDLLVTDVREFFRGLR